MNGLNAHQNLNQYPSVCSSPVWNDCILTVLHYCKLLYDELVMGHILCPHISLHAVSLAHHLFAVLMLDFSVVDQIAAVADLTYILDLHIGGVCFLL